MLNFGVDVTFAVTVAFWEEGLSGLLWSGSKPKLPKTFPPPKIPSFAFFCFLWNAPGSCCSDLTHFLVYIYIYIYT